MASKYVIGVDGGGTKTAVLLIDDSGNVLASTITGGSNHQIVGLDLAVGNVMLGIENVCHVTGIDLSCMRGVYIGIAGADLESDFFHLNTKFSEKIKEVPFFISNDIWNVFSAETILGWGAVSICGTGNNLAVTNLDGKVFSVRALRYVLGNYGGGNHLTQMALHHAFRFSEGTGEQTRLVETLPAFCECLSMSELADRIYLSNYQYYRKYNISSLVYRLAMEGDHICIRIISEMGKELGSMMGHLIGSAGMATEKVPVVLSGGLYVNDTSYILINAYENELRNFVPNADVKLARNLPVVGAAIMALRNVNLCISEEIIDRIRQGVNESLGKTQENRQ